MKLNKNILTNIISVFIIAAGYLSPFFKDNIVTVGFFSLSGALTNWIAVYMLFEKIPFLYGSGVVQIHFEDFKKGISNLIMKEFFTEDNVDKFFKTSHADNLTPKMNFKKVIEALDYDAMFNSLLDVIASSPFGGMLNMFGGSQAIEPLRNPFKEKMRTVVENIAASDNFRKALEENILSPDLNKDIVEKVEGIINSRLDELTPKMVKEIVKNMINEHLGWLVVWGGVFGGLIGLIMSFVK